MKIEHFGRMPDGAEVQRIFLNAHGLSANILTYGSLVQDLRLEGHAPPLVLGFDEFAPYLTHSPAFGITAGRCANRIGEGRFTLDGEEYQLDKNDLHKHHLHGGAVGTGKRLWQIKDAQADSVHLSIELSDGEMGYPGNIAIDVIYQLKSGGVFDITMTARSDKTTLCNLAHHSYFNLDGSADILDHQLTVAADHYIPVNQEHIPTGKVEDVSDTPFDFRAPKAIGAAHAMSLLDHNFCLSTKRQDLRMIGKLESSISNIQMEIHTTEPGIQIYDGAKVDIPLPGLDGMMMGPHAGIALEPQTWPDAINNPSFPQAVLRPGEAYNQHTQYVFKRG